MEDVRSGRVVNNNDSLKLTSKSTEVLDVVPAMEDARLAKQTRAKYTPLIEQVSYRIGVLGQRSSEKHAFVQLAHLA